VKKSHGAENRPLFEQLFQASRMDCSMRLFVEWPSGSRLPVRIAGTATGADLLNLLSFCCRGDQQITLVSNGVCIDPRSHLSQQRIHENSTIKVVKVSDSVTIGTEATDYPLSDQLFESICPELLRLTDIQFSIVEGHRSARQVYRTMLVDESDTDESDSEQPRTVFPVKPSIIPKDPLPLWDGLNEEAMDGFDLVGQSEGGENSLFPTQRFRREWDW
jgi:hypothetical protein